MTLNPLGAKLLLHIKVMMKTVAEIEELTSDFYDGSKGIINLGTYTTASSYLLPPMLKQFFNNYSKIRINYNYEATERILEMICNYELDCAVLSEVPSDPKLDILPFFKDELLFVTSSKNLKTSIKISPKDLKDFSYLSYPLRYDYCYRTIEQTYGVHLKKAHTPIETTSFETLKQSLLQGIGATFMPSYMIKEELSLKKLTKIEIGNKKIPIVFSFVTKKNALLNKATSELKNQIQKYYSLAP